MYSTWTKWSVTNSIKNNTCIIINLKLLLYFTGNISRRCIMDDQWEEINFCFNEKTAILLNQVILY